MSPKGWSSLRTKLSVVLFGVPSAVSVASIATTEGRLHENDRGLRPFPQRALKMATAVADARYGLPVAVEKRFNDDFADGSRYRTLVCMQALER